MTRCGGRCPPASAAESEAVHPEWRRSAGSRAAVCLRAHTPSRAADGPQVADSSVSLLMGPPGMCAPPAMPPPGGCGRPGVPTLWDCSPPRPVRGLGRVGGRHERGKGMVWRRPNEDTGPTMVSAAASTTRSFSLCMILVGVGCGVAAEGRLVRVAYLLDHDRAVHARVEGDLLHRRLERAPDDHQPGGHRRTPRAPDIHGTCMDDRAPSVPGSARRGENGVSRQAGARSRIVPPPACADGYDPPHSRPPSLASSTAANHVPGGVTP